MSERIVIYGSLSFYKPINWLCFAFTPDSSVRVSRRVEIMYVWTTHKNLLKDLLPQENLKYMEDSSILLDPRGNTTSKLGYWSSISVNLDKTSSPVYKISLELYGFRLY